MIRNWMSLTALTACCLLGRVSIAAADGVPECCPDGGCTKTVCQPILKNKVVSTRVFTDRKEEFCLPCSAFSCLFPNKCGCSHVKTKKLLILKIRKCEKCEKTCVPVQVPVSAPCKAAPCAVAPCAPDYLPAAPASHPAIIAIPTMPAGPMVLPSAR